MEYTLNTNKGEFLLVEIQPTSVNFYTSMGYLLYSAPDYDNWVTDNELADPFKLDKYLSRVKDKSDWKKVAVKLPDVNYKFIAVTQSAVLDRHEASQNLTKDNAEYIIDTDNALDSFNRLLISKSIPTDKPYVILKKISK